MIISTSDPFFVKSDRLLEEQVPIADKEERVRKVKRFVADTGIGEALCYLLKEIWHWPSSWQRGGFVDDRHLKVEVIEAVKLTTNERACNEHFKVRFRYADHVYGFEFEESHSSGDYKWGDIVFTENDAVVFDMHVCQHLDGRDDYNDYSLVSVKALVVGSWIGHCIEMATTTRASRDKRLREMQAEVRLQHADKLPDL
jgi:hypothetical protein